jgi:hypothetical protein
MSSNIENLEGDPPTSAYDAASAKWEQFLPKVAEAEKAAASAKWALDMSTKNHKPLTPAEKAFWKDAFLACAQSTLNGKHLAPDQATVGFCADFADAAMDAYRDRVIWRKP